MLFSEKILTKAYDKNSIPQQKPTPSHKIRRDLDQTEETSHYERGWTWVDKLGL